MRLKRIIRNKLLEKLPRKYQLNIERFYLCYCVKNYVKTEAKFFKKLCNPNLASLDIGANLGVLTLFLSKYSYHVYCFEPIPSLCTYIRKKYEGCNVTVENCALGDEMGEFYLYIPIVGNTKYESRASLNLNANHEYIHGKKVDNIEKIKVKLKKLDDFQLKNVGFIKIDVEGFEYEVLKGARETIKSNMPNIFIEIEQRYHKDSIYDIFQYIKKLGYFGYFEYQKNIKQIGDFDVDIMQKNVKQGNLYINNFIFSPSSGLKI